MVKNVIVFLLLLIVAVIFSGCSGQSCIKVGGEYSGVNGELEYCYSPDKTQQNGAPTLESAQGELYALTAAQIEELNQYFDKAAAVKPTAAPTNETPIRRLLRRLQPRQP